MKLGKKHVELAMRWLPSAATYGTTGALALFYFTDWRVVVNYIPYYNGKFQEN